MVNRENLKILSDGLLGLIPSIEDTSQVHFDMESYSDVNEADDSYFHRNNAEIKMKTCGSVGCAIGWAPFFGIEKHLNEDWIDFSERVFGLSNGSDEWDYLFSSDWGDVDNSKKGAGLRIKNFLEHGLPEDSHDQLQGEASLSYRDDKGW